VSERDGGGGTLGPFLLGVAVGAALGALFAPDTGEVTRRQLGKKLRGLKDLAEDKADELKALVAGAGDDGEDEDDEDDGGDEDHVEAEPRSARDELEQRLAEARRRRRKASRTRDSEEEDEPVA
jgi:gas vesicle protein